MDEKGVYASYYAFEGRVDRLQPHQVLALNRGEKEGILKVRVEMDERDWHAAIAAEFQEDILSPFSDQLSLAIADSAERLLLPAIERDVRRELSEKADGHAINVFATNLRALLSQPPLAGQTVLGLDPGFRTGTKLAVVDPTGKLLDTGTIYPHEPKNDWAGALSTLEEMVNRHHVTLITIGNGTASRETEKLVAELTRGHAETTKYLIVNEAGASVYSASALARQEFPALGCLHPRGGLHRPARPGSVGRAGQDRPQVHRGRHVPARRGSVRPRALAGWGGGERGQCRRRGFEYRQPGPADPRGRHWPETGHLHRDLPGCQRCLPFPRRVALASPVWGRKPTSSPPGSCASARAPTRWTPPPSTPNRMPVAGAVLARAGLSPAASIAERKPALDALVAQIPPDKLAAELGCGLPTLKDILEQLVRPGRDPRADAPAPILRSDVLKAEDLLVGMTLKGTVRNVVDFGAFVDIGVKQDGLLHKSHIPHGTLLKVGDILDLEILKIEPERGRISLGWVSSHDSGVKK